MSNIVLEYDHPHYKTIINDNTARVDRRTQPSEGAKFICVFGSKKGIDNVFVKHTNEVQFVEEFGKGNFATYGQPYYNAHVALSTRHAECYCMRVMPTDAAYSNLIIKLKYKVEENEQAVKQLKIRHEVISTQNLIKKADFQTQVDMVANEDPDADGYITIPLMGFYTVGRGTYGNDHRVRLTNVFGRDKNQLFKTYRLEVLEADNGLQQKELFEASIYENAIVGNNTMFYEDIVNDTENGSKKVNMYVNPYVSDFLYELYKEEICPETTISRGMFDILFGYNIDKTPIKNMIVETEHEGFVALDRMEGVPLNNGTEGALEVSGFNVFRQSQKQTKDDVLTNLYAKAFRGELDRSILSKRRLPARIILDAGYPLEVKKEMYNLALKRYDAFLHLDAGIIHTLTEALQFGETMSLMNDRIASKDFQHYKIKDPFSGKALTMTTSYFLAANLPIHLETIGEHVPFVGEDKARLNNMIKGSLLPLIESDDEEMKEKLYDLRLNYFDCLTENTFIKATQQTAQEAETDLSEINNMYTLLEMKRVLEYKIATMLYDFTEPSDRSTFKEDADEALKPFTHKVRNFKVDFEMTAYEEENNIIHCYLAVVYKSLGKRGIIEIDINKRTI